MTVARIPCPTDLALTCASSSTQPPEGGTVGMTHFADGEIEAQSRHSSVWQGRGPELCQPLLAARPTYTCGG